MKRVFKILIIIFLIFVFIPLIKNIFLYASYNREPTILLKEGKLWTGVFDRIFPESSYDMRLSISLEQLSDSVGIMRMKGSRKRINGKESNTYGWGALLPYSSEFEYVQNDTVRLVKKYVPYMKVNWDQVYIYKISNDSMFISELFPPEYFAKHESKKDNEERRRYFNKEMKNIFITTEDYCSWGIGPPNIQYDFIEVVNILNIPNEWEQLYNELFE